MYYVPKNWKLIKLFYIVPCHHFYTCTATFFGIELQIKLIVNARIAHTIGSIYHLLSKMTPCKTTFLETLEPAVSDSQIETEKH